MARIRTIKPEFPQSESMGRVSREARLCFVLLWTCADDDGRLRANSRLLASLLYPYDDDAPGLIDGWLAELEAEGCIRRYEVEGNAYLDIPKWLNHQKIDHSRPSKMPPFREDSRIVATPSRNLAVDRTKEGTKEGSRSADAEREQPFEQFWQAYPRKQGKGAAERAFKQAVSQTSLPDLLAALERQKPTWTDPKYTPMPTTWLNQKRWLDEIPGTKAHAAAPGDLYRQRCEAFRKSGGTFWDPDWGQRPGEEAA